MVMRGAMPLLSSPGITLHGLDPASPMAGPGIRVLWGWCKPKLNLWSLDLPPVLAILIQVDSQVVLSSESRLGQLRDGDSMTSPTAWAP